MDWRQELKHNITTAEELRMHIPMSDEELSLIHISEPTRH